MCSSLEVGQETNSRHWKPIDNDLTIRRCLPSRGVAFDCAPLLIELLCVMDLPADELGQYLAVYNALSFGIAGVGSADIFLWLQMPHFIW